MSEHEKLKWICDEIGYENPKYWYNDRKKFFIKETETELWEGEGTCASLEECDVDVIVDVREIIFTPEFMEKFKKKYYNEDNLENCRQNMYWKEQLIDSNLHDPTAYLHNLLKQ